MFLPNSAIHPHGRMDPLPLFSDNRYATNKLFFRIHGARCIGEGALVGYEPLRIKFPALHVGWLLWLWELVSFAKSGMLWLDGMGKETAANVAEADESAKSPGEIGGAALGSKAPVGTTGSCSGRASRDLPGCSGGISGKTIFSAPIGATQRLQRNWPTVCTCPRTSVLKSPLPCMKR